MRALDDCPSLVGVPASATVIYKKQCNFGQSTSHISCNILNTIISNAFHWIFTNCVLVVIAPSTSLFVDFGFLHKYKYWANSVTMAPVNLLSSHVLMQIKKDRESKSKHCRTLNITVGKIDVHQSLTVVLIKNTNHTITVAIYVQFFLMRNM